MRKLVLVASVLTLALCLVPFSSDGQTIGKKRRRPPRDAYGNVVIDNYSTQADVAPVEFKHWLHRARYSCGLCHVDIGFAMEAGATGMREEDNRNGEYCGACHNGKVAFAPLVVGGNGQPEQKNCDRCHSVGKQVPGADFRELASGLPRGRFGNGIDWTKAHDEDLIETVDFLEGVSFERRAVRSPEDIEQKAGIVEMPDIIFSHRKHATWSGCEGCHPDIFPVKRGAVKYTMQEIFAGRFCGACHGTVAFPTTDCRACHVKDAS